MSDEAEEELFRIAAELADGKPVDWTNLHSADPEISARMQDLRAIESMALALRRKPHLAATAEWLEPGTILGRFRIERKAEQGGMGIVYLAHDQVLGRPVALKLLPPNVVHSPERLARLSGEAKLLASLNHPNIATIHGMEGGEGELRYLVLEWISGETLAALLKHGPLSVREALVICAQISLGVAAAHESGVIHRDLKPSNVMFAPGGRVKVVDFGLARRGVREASQSGVSDTGATGMGGSTGAELDERAAGGSKPAGAEVDKPTAAELSSPMVGGTWGYLSPECLTGEDDHRADIFAFGCVLYECLVGAPAFPGKTVEEIHYAVLHEEPDLGRLPKPCPPIIQRLIADCLEKNPERRLASMAEAARVIEVTLGRRALERSESRANLPIPLTSFVGREGELERCRALLQAGRLLTLVGPGGAGKTRLALALARAVEGSFSEGTWFIDLSSVPKGSHVVEALGAALGVQEGPGTPLLMRIAQQLSTAQALVILDNCEHVVDDCAVTVRTLLESCPGIALLATSRVALRSPGEQALSIEPLPVPDIQELDNAEAVARYDSVRLFVERASEAERGRAFGDPPASGVTSLADPAALRAIGEICLRVEGLPLAIELAASRVRVLSVQEIAVRLDHQLHLLRDPRARMTPRHQALQATIAWSVDQLPPSEAALFRALAVFAGGWDLAAAAVVCGSSSPRSATDEFDTLDQISSLVEKSLVSVSSGKSGLSRYRFLEPVRQFALNELTAKGEDKLLRLRHCEYYLALAEEAEPLLYGAEQGHWLDRLADEHSNMLAALDYCYGEHDGIERGLRLVGALGRYWHVRGHVDLGTWQVERMLQRAGADLPTRPRAQALSIAGALASWRGDLEKARHHLDEALLIFQRVADRRGEGRALLALGGVASNSGDLERGYEFYARGLQAYRETGDLRGVATVLVNMGVVAYARGDRTGAHQLFGEAIDLHRRTGDRVTLALALGNRSALSVQLGDHDAARAELTEALQLSLELDAVWGGTSAIATVAMLAMAGGAFASAAWMLGAATSCVEKSGLHLPTGQRHEMEQMVAQTKTSLSADAFEEAWERGRGLSFREAAGEVIAWLAGPTADG